MSSKTNVNPFDYAKPWGQALAESGWWHSFELPDGTQIRGVNDLKSLKNRISQFPIPEDLHGKRVLDIGAWDGWFSFEMERRGAEVVAIDCWDNPRFHEMRERLGSRVDYQQLDVYELTPERVGRFDIVLFFGVLYHLKHPLLALERICALTTEMAAVDSFVLRDQHHPGEHLNERSVMEFYEHDEFGGQTDNWVAPSLPCLLAFCRTAGFARVEWRNTLEFSACVACYRQWEPPQQPQKSPVLETAFHFQNFGINFRTDLDDYISAMFQWDAPQLGIADVKPEVDGFGIQPISVERKHGGWLANFKLPPGLDRGWHEAVVRAGASGPSNPYRIAVDMPALADSIEIRSICDSQTWKPSEVDLNGGDAIALWVDGLPENADRNNVRVYLDGKRVDVVYVETGAAGTRQVNATIPKEAGPGTRNVTVKMGSTISAPAELRILS